MSSTRELTLVASDIGNVNLKYRRFGRVWHIEPSTVRVSPANAAFRLDGGDPVRPFVYESGPAEIPNTPFLIGSDAMQVDSPEVPTIGTALMRVRSVQYLVLHLYTIIASLPPGVTHAKVAFAGGLPLMDSKTPQVENILRQRLTGRKAEDVAAARARGERIPAVPHVIRWGEVVYHITIDGTSFTPQPHAGIASIIFSKDGQVAENGGLKRMRFGLDIGGGTTDFVGLVGMKPIEGTEGGVTIGIANAAEYAREEIVRRWPQMSSLEIGTLLDRYRSEHDRSIFIGGSETDISSYMNLGVERAAEDVLAHVLRHWQRRLPEGEVLLFGGGSQELCAPITRVLSQTTTVRLLEKPVTRVVEGLERLARFNMRQAELRAQQG